MKRKKNQPTNICLKCRGLMVAERISAGYCNEAYGFWWWRCINCGLIIDPTILRHQKDQPRPKTRPSRARHQSQPCLTH